MSRGIVLLGGKDAAIQGRGKKAGLPVMVSGSYEIPFEKTLFVEPGTRVPWGLLPAAWHFLDKWDASVPLWRYGTTAADVGIAEERAATQAIARDLRVLLHAVELLFVRKNEDGAALVKRWSEERAGGGDKRLAFLRALYQVKPRLCVLPTSWLASNVAGRLASNIANMKVTEHGRGVSKGGPLVRVELEPGRYVKCHAGDEERVLAHFRRQKEVG